MSNRSLVHHSPEKVGELLNVSRETLTTLRQFVELLKLWQSRINLVSKNTINDVWNRHILDCGQLCRYLPNEECTVADIGSGAGLPGLVIAMISKHHVHSIESDRRKAAFQRQIVGELGLSNVSVHACRVEEVQVRTDYVMSRALASLPELALLASPIATRTTRFLLLKGQNVHSELTQLQSGWKFNWSCFPSLSDLDGRVVLLEELSRRS